MLVLRQKHMRWSCTSPAITTYSTYDLAMIACLKDTQCSYIYDKGCDNRGPFQLCTSMSLIESSETDCLYSKDGNHQRNIYIYIYRFVDCTDISNNCADFASQCGKTMWMARNCRKSCNLCTPSSEGW